MHLKDIAAPNRYTFSADDVADFLQQLDGIWPHSHVALALRCKKQSQPNSRKVSNRPSLACHIDGICHSDRHCTS
jgi:hypothetical protein